jgi:hypothetical protein
MGDDSRESQDATTEGRFLSIQSMSRDDAVSECQRLDVDSTERFTEHVPVEAGRSDTDCAGRRPGVIWR